ncbi:hypothetical protein SNK03_13635 [Fusarium graminearum]
MCRWRQAVTSQRHCQQIIADHGNYFLGSHPAQPCAIPKGVLFLFNLTSLLLVEVPANKPSHTMPAALSAYGAMHLLLFGSINMEPNFLSAHSVDNRKSCSDLVTEDPMGLPSTKSLRFPVVEHSRDLIDSLNYSGHFLQIYQDTGFLGPHQQPATTDNSEYRFIRSLSRCAKLIMSSESRVIPSAGPDIRKEALLVPSC